MTHTHTHQVHQNPTVSLLGISPKRFSTPKSKGFGCWLLFMKGAEEKLETRFRHLGVDIFGAAPSFLRYISYTYQDMNVIDSRYMCVCVF